MKNKTIKIIAIKVGIVIALLIIIGIAANTPKSVSNRYGSEAIRVLEKYKNFDIDAKETTKRIKDLMEIVEKEEKKEAEYVKKHRLTLLWMDLMSIHTKLYHSGSATGYEINEAINRVKKDIDKEAK